MIKVTRLNGEQLVINAELIELIEAKPDTIITLSTGEKYIARDKVDEIIEKVIRYKQTINLPQTRE